MATVLTVIGIVLLVLLALIILLLCQPVRYAAEVRRGDVWTVYFKIDYAWELFETEIRYDSGAGLFWLLRLPFGEWNSQQEAVEDLPPEQAEPETAPPVAETPAAAEPEGVQPEPAATDTSEQEEVNEEIIGTAAAEPAEAQAASAEPEETPQPAEKKVPAKAYLEVVRYAIGQGIIDATALYMQRVWNRTKPRYIEGEARLGLADAYTQGLLCGALYAALPQVAARIEFTYIEEVMAGYLRLGGGIRPIGVLWDSLRWLAAPAVWRTAWYYRQTVRKYREESK